MRKANRLAFAGLFTLLSLTPVFCTAKVEEWQDAQGGSFRAEAAEDLGPLALFRSAKRGARMVPFHLLAPADCVRFHEQIKDSPPRADDWRASANRKVSYEVREHAMHVQDQRLVPADLTGRREPRFFIVIYGTNGDGKGWEVIDAVLPLYRKLQAAFPGEAEALFFGVDHKSSDHRNMAVSKQMPWLVTDLSQQPNMTILRRFIPGTKVGVVVFSRDGVPLFSRDASEFDQIAQPVADLIVLLETIRPENPKGWKDRAHYLRAIRPVVFAQGHADPVLIGNPLVPEGLRQRKIRRVEATLTVAADGAVTRVDLNSSAADLPTAMRSPIADALQKACIFVPAVHNGQFVDGMHLYVLDVGG